MKLTISPTFKNPKEAFDQAIKAGFLSTDKTADNYAGKWMYMHSNAGNDAFKNIITREYVIAKYQ